MTTAARHGKGIIIIIELLGARTVSMSLQRGASEGAVGPSTGRKSATRRPANSGRAPRLGHGMELSGAEDGGLRGDCGGTHHRTREASEETAAARTSPHARQGLNTVHPRARPGPQRGAWHDDIGHAAEHSCQQGHGQEATTRARKPRGHGQRQEARAKRGPRPRSALRRAQALNTGSGAAADPAAAHRQPQKRKGASS